LKWFHTARGSLLLKTLRFVFLTGLFLFITLTVLSMVLESTGISRAAATPRNMEFEPAANQKIFKFTDVHGVDEAKEVCDLLFFCSEADILSSRGRILWR
jgi:ATP-dependent Zn protease